MAKVSVINAVTWFRPENGNRRPRQGADETGQTVLPDQKTVVCSDCGAVYLNNRWSWDIRPENVDETLCPACQRVQNRMPEGILTVRGECLKEHRNEIMRLIRSRIQKTGSKYPLKRIMDMEGDETEAVFTFTDAQLTREIGDTLHQTFDGVLDFLYSSDANMLRVTWQR